MQRDLLSGLFWCAIGVGICFWSFTYPIGTLTHSGPGYFPMVLGGVITILSILSIAKALKTGTREGERLSGLFGSRWQRVLSVLVVLFCAALLFDRIGYLLTFFFLPLVLMIIAGLREWKRIAFIAFCTALGIYVVFVVLLKQPLPTGFLGI